MRMKLLNLDDLMKKGTIRNADLARDLGVSEKAVSEWRQGLKFPRDKALSYLIGKFGPLHVEADTGEIYILGLEINPSPAPVQPGEKVKAARTA